MAASSLLFPMKHQGQLGSETTSTTIYSFVPVSIFLGQVGLGSCQKERCETRCKGDRLILGLEVEVEEARGKKREMMMMNLMKEEE